MGFTKLDSGIINSSIWEEHSDVLKVFIAFWTKSNSDGIVNATEGSIFRSANLLDENKNPRDKQYFDKILLILLSPDHSSKTKNNDGKRILRIDESSWLIVNYKKYREYTYSDNPESVRKRAYRKRDMSQSVLGHSASASASELELIKGNEDPKHDTVSKCEGVQGEDNNLFETFWKSYPRKQGKGACIKIWAKLKEPDDTLKKILAALTWQRTSDQWTKDGGQFIPMPATYLNQARWLDDAVIAQPTKAEEYEMIRERIRLKKERGEL